MSTLELERVGRRYGKGAGQRIVLREVTLSVHPGELVAIWGLRRSGRTTLMRVAAGVEPASSGVVRLHGHDLANDGASALGSEIGYFQRLPRDLEAKRSALDGLIFTQLARGIQPRQARARALEALERAGASECAASWPGDLRSAEQTRVMLARALTSEPSLLVIDDPVRDVDLLERDTILALLRSIANEGIAVLMSAAIATGLQGADRALTLAEGELHGSIEPELAEVLPLRRQRTA